VDLFHDLHFISVEMESIVNSQIIQKANSAGIDPDIFKQANEEAQRRILEPTNNIKQHVQVKNINQFYLQNGDFSHKSSFYKNSSRKL
jgi:hypothetical protein